MKQTLLITGCVWWLFAAGCGTDFGRVLLFTGESAGRTFIDVLISDFYSDAPDLVIFPGGPGDTVATDGTADVTADGAGNPTGAEPNEPAPPEGGAAVDLTGDADRGATVFAANSCTSCHCDDASGGCLPTAPDLRGTDLATLQEKLQGGGPHVGGQFPDLTAQNFADLATFLAQ